MIRGEQGALQERLLQSDGRSVEQHEVEQEAEDNGDFHGQSEKETMQAMRGSVSFGDSEECEEQNRMPESPEAEELPVRAIRSGGSLHSEERPPATYRKGGSLLRSATAAFVDPKDLEGRSIDRMRTFVAGRFQRGMSLRSDDTQDSDYSLDSVLEREWYRKIFDVAYFMEEQYWFCYLGYLILAMFIGTIAFLIADPNMNPWDAFFAAACSVSQSGLATVNWSEQKTAVHIVSVFLIFAGSMPLLTLWPVLLRRHSFRQQVSIEALEGARTHKRTRARQAVEYQALGKCVVLVLMNWFVIQLVGTCIISLHAVWDKDVSERLDELGLHPWWHGFYLSVSAYQNNGLALTPTSVEPLRDQPVPLLVVAFLILMGNTCFPIVMRLTATLRHSTLRPGSDRRAYSFLLEHPRRCFTHMFPAVQTLWLLVVAGALLAVQTFVFVQQNYDMPVAADMTWLDLVLNGFFQAASSRTAGLNSVDIQALTAATVFLLLVCMYISSSPTVVIMKYSADRNDSLELDITGRPEGHEEVDAEKETVGSQAKRHLYQHATILIFFTFLIFCFERQPFLDSVTRTCEYGEKQLYADYSAIKVFFEVASAYGTVGLSLGYRSSPASFSGSLSRASQVLLVWMMILGRLRGLPESIDPSVAFTMREHDDHTAFIAVHEDGLPSTTCQAASQGRDRFNRPSVRGSSRESPSRPPVAEELHSPASG